MHERIHCFTDNRVVICLVIIDESQSEGRPRTFTKYKPKWAEKQNGKIWLWKYFKDT